MNAIWMRTRSELRGRWRSTVLIVLLIGVTGGVALTAAAGARRTETAYPRFLQATNTENYVVSASQSGSGLYPDVARLPEVADSSVVDGLPLFYGPRPRNVDPSVQIVASQDGGAGYTIQKMHMLSGRPPAPDRPFEIAASLQFARKYHLQPGDHIDAYRWDPGTNHPATGPNGAPIMYRLLVTGVSVSFDEIIPIAPLDSLPEALGTPALARLFPNKEALNFDGLLVRLRPGADPAGFRAGVQQASARHPEAKGYFLSDERDRERRVQNAIRPEALALAIFALLTAVAGLLAIAQILSRRIFLDATDYPTLRSVGMSRHQLVSVSLIRGFFLAVGGALVACGLAILASPLMPIGPARLAEPHNGFEINLAILGIGFVATVVLVTLIAGFAGWRAARAEGSALGTIEVRGGERPSRIADNASRAGLAPSVVSGVRFALEPGRGRTAVPVRTAMIGIVFAVAAVTASFTFGSNLSRLVDSPSQFGRTWDVDLDTGFGGMPKASIAKVFGGDRDVAAYAGGVYGEVVIEGHQIPAVGIDGLDGYVFPTIVRGRTPVNGREIALGAQTLRTIGASVGDTVSVRTPSGEHPMRIVGQAVFPSMGQGSFSPTGLGEGAAMTRSPLPTPFFPQSDYTFVLARFRPGVDRAAAIRTLEVSVHRAQLCPADQQCEFRTSMLPAELATYPAIKTVPVVLAALLILIGIAVTAHTLVTSVQRRRHDLATLKTLGFVRPQVLATVIAQASVFAAVGLIVGIPVGIALGRWAWTAFANQLGVPPSPIVPLAIVGIAIPATLLIAEVTAAWPGRSAARTQPAVVLRAE